MTRGGARPGSGRKPKFGERMTRHQVILDPETVSTLTDLGDGNLSQGIRKAARRTKTQRVGY